MAQVHLLVTCLDVVSGEIADHARDTRERRRCEHVGNEHVHQRLFIVGLPLPFFVALAKFGTAHERTGVELDLVGLVGRLGYETAEVRAIGFGRLAEQVHHEMRVRLEAEQAREVERSLNLRDAHGALVDVVNVLVKALNSHLHLRCTKRAQEGEVLRCDQARARFDHQTHRAVRRLLVAHVFAFELIERGVLMLRDRLPRFARFVEVHHSFVIGELPFVDQALLRLREGNKVIPFIAQPAIAIELAAFAGVRRLKR